MPTIKKSRLTSRLCLLLCFLSLILTGACSDKKEDDSGKISRHLANSKNYRDQGQYRAAILEARNAIAKTSSQEAVLQLADLHIELGQSRAAINTLEAVTNKNDSILLKLARAYAESQKYASAEKTLNQIAEASQNNIEYDITAGLAAAGVSNNKKATLHFDKALAKEPGNFKALSSKLIVALRENKQAEVQKLYDQVKTEHATSPEALLLLAKIEYQKTNFTEAENLLMTAIHNTGDTDIMLPVKSAVLQLLIETLTQQGRYADAVPFNKVLSESNPGWKEAQEALKIIVQKIQSGDWAEAEALLNQFQEDHPNNNAAQSLMGLVSLQKGDFEDADAILENAVDPETASPVMVGASVLSKLRNNEKLEAYAILKEALATKPDNVKLLGIYGALALELEGKVQEGEQSLIKVLELDPGEARVYGLLARYYFQEKQVTKARDLLLKAYEFNPEVEQIQYSIVRSFGIHGLKEETHTFVQGLQKNAPSKAGTWVASALYSMQSQDHKQASKYLDKALELDDQNVAAWTLAAATHLKLNDQKAAATTLEKALVQFPENQTWLVQAAQLHMANNNLDKANEKANTLENMGEPSKANYIRADILHREGKTEEAYKLLLSEWKVKPGHRLAVMIMRYAATTKNILSEEFIQKWQEIAADNPLAHLAIGNVYLQQGDPDKALDSFESVIKLDENNVIALNNAAWFHQEKGNSTRALELANKTLPLAKENAAVLDTVGWIKFQNGDDTSLEILKKAAELAPDAKEIQDHYQQARSKYN